MLRASPTPFYFVHRFISTSLPCQFPSFTSLFSEFVNANPNFDSTNRCEGQNRYKKQQQNQIQRTSHDVDDRKSYWTFANIDKTCSRFYINVLWNVYRATDAVGILPLWMADVMLTRFLQMQREREANLVQHLKGTRSIFSTQFDSVRCKIEIAVRSINDLQNLISFCHWFIDASNTRQTRCVSIDVWQNHDTSLFVPWQHE